VITATSNAPRNTRRRPPAAGKGRKRGVPNRVTLETREAFRQLLEGNTSNMQRWLDRTAARSPKALSILVHLAEYVTPKLLRAEVRPAGSGADLTAARLGQGGVGASEAAAAYQLLLTGCEGSPTHR